MENVNSLISMVISELLVLILFFTILFTQKKGNQLKKIFLLLLTFLFSWTLGYILQIWFQDTDVDPFLFTKLTGIFVFFTPVIFFALSTTFTKTKIKITKKHLLLLIIPSISNFLLLTNDYHHLMFINYSSDIKTVIYGKYFTIHSIYTYALYIISVILLLRYSFKNLGFFSRQSLLLILGVSIPIILNVLGTTRIIEATTYITPMSFSFMLLFFALAIFKFQFISSAPIALQRIVDRISDSYIILDEFYNITDFNKTLLHTFNINAENIRGKNIFKLSSKTINESLQSTLKETIEELKYTQKTFQFEQEIPEISKVFTVEISNIYTKNNFLGILILFKDITQHKKDIQTIQNNQDILVEQERLASLGQMIGGIAHNLKTPIFSITGGLEGLNNLVNEFDLSIDNNMVTNADMHDIAKDMYEWIEKLKGHISYMSDVITTVKGQAVTLSENETINFSITELFKRVDILMRHEIKNALATLDIQNNVGDVEILAGITTLVNN